MKRRISNSSLFIFAHTDIHFTKRPLYALSLLITLILVIKYRAKIRVIGNPITPIFYFVLLIIPLEDSYRHLPVRPLVHQVYLLLLDSTLHLVLSFRYLSSHLQSDEEHCHL